MRTYLTRPLILLGVLLLSHCTDEASSLKLKGLREEIEQLNQQNYEATQQIRRLKAQIDSFRDEKAKLDSERGKVDEAKGAADKRLEELKLEFDAYKQKYKLSMRTRAPGMELADFAALDGKTYMQVVLRELTDDVVRFSHRDGTTKLAPKLLPLELQDKLGYLVPTVAVRSPEIAHLTAKQQDKMERANHEYEIGLLGKKITEIRQARDKARNHISEANYRIRNAQNNKTDVTEEKRLVPQYEAAIVQAEAEIAKLEIEIHTLRVKGYQSED